MDIYLNYFWMVALLFNVITAPVYWRRIKKEMEQFPEKEPGYKSLIASMQFWINLPWIVMGLGFIFGDVSSVFDYLRPGDGNLWVWTFYIALLTAWFNFIVWIFLFNGARKLIEYPGFINKNFQDVRLLRLWALMSLVFGGVFFYLLFSGKLQFIAEFH